MIRRAYNPKNKEEVFYVLWKEIQAARLKVILDKQLGRRTSDTVLRLAQMKLPSRPKRNPFVERS